ncbi:MAG: transporter substrate-binding domain-containing protein [Desulfosarcinaceae bacterium]|nr:transporter substrate-binding domain-containing protein [Desulfosarcinaceae bacterium]
MRINIIPVILVTGLILVASGPAGGEPLVWYQADFPPYVILAGPDKALGIDNQIMAYMIERLPGYEHQFRVASYSRILNDFKRQKPGVTTPLFRTPEREEYVHYSDISSYLVLPNGFIYQKDDLARYAPYLLADGAIDLDALCQSGKFNIGISAGRSYFGIIDAMIRNYKTAGVFQERTGSDQLGTLKMVRIKRYDAAFGFPVEIKYGGLERDLRFLRVSGMVPFIPVFFGTPKNQWGISLMGKFNAILRQEGVLERFAQFYSAWLDEETRPFYDQLRHTYYGK